MNDTLRSRGPGFVRALLVRAAALGLCAAMMQVAHAQPQQPGRDRQQEAPVPPPSVTESARDIDWVGIAEKRLAQGGLPAPRQGRPRMRRQPWFMDDELLARAGVDEETATAIRETIARVDAERTERTAEKGSDTGSAMRDLTKLLLSDQFTEEKAREMLDDVLAQRAELLRVQLEPKIQVRSLLTASQIAAIQAERPRFFMEPLTMPRAPRPKEAEGEKQTADPDPGDESAD